MKNSKKNIEKLLKKSADGFVPSAPLDIAGREIKDFDFLAEESDIVKMPQKKAQKPHRNFAFKFMSAISAFILLAAIGFGSYFGYVNSEISTIYLDINPSLYIVTDRLDRVKSVGTYNREAALLLEGLSIKGKPLNDALEMILDESYLSGYLTAYDQNEMLIGVEGNEKKKNDVKKEKIKGFLTSLNLKKPYRVNFDIRETKAENKKDALVFGISPSKYILIKQIIEADRSYTVSELKNKSIKELKIILSEITNK